MAIKVTRHVRMGDDKPGAGNGKKLFVGVLLLCLLFALLFVYFFGFSQPARTTATDGQTAVSLDDPDGRVWYKSAAATKDPLSPAKPSDAHVVMGLEVPNKKVNRSGIQFIPAWATSMMGAGKWEIPLVITCLGSARANNSDIPSDSMLLQRLEFIFPGVKKLSDRDENVIGRMEITTGSFEAWPSREQLPSNWISDMSESALYAAVIGEMNHNTSFPLSPSEFAKRQGGDMWYSYGTGEDEERHPEVFYSVNFPYEQKLGKDVSDCGFTSEVDYLLSPGKTYELELAATTFGWGYSPKISLRVRITAPPDPEGMSAQQLGQYGITLSSDNLYQGRQYLYSIDASNLSIEVT